MPGQGRSPGGGHGNPLQYSCLENTMDSGAWQAMYGPQHHNNTEATQHTLRLIGIEVDTHIQLYYTQYAFLYQEDDL